MLLTSWCGWVVLFPAIDRLVHHSTIFELNVESYRRRNANHKQKERRQSTNTTGRSG
jgi:hypothetical protein